MKFPPLVGKLIYFLLRLYNRNSGGIVINRPSSMEAKSRVSFYTIAIKDIDGIELALDSFKGKKVLLVNTASACGYTPQYNDLEKLYQQYKKDLVILALPCNDFGAQEPLSADEIKAFCNKQYPVSFHITEKVKIKGPGRHPLYQWLSDKNLNGWNETEPSWNFCKYLIDEQGELFAFYSEKMNPLGNEMAQALIR